MYRALFYVAMIFFLVTTLFPFYWLIVLAVTPDGNLLSGSFVPTLNSASAGRSRCLFRRASIPGASSPSSNRCRSTCSC